MRRIGWLFGILLIVAGGESARADQAADIKQSLEAALADWSDNGQNLTHGAIGVAADGAAFVVSIPDVRLFPNEQGYLDVGTVGFRLTPDGDDLYKVDDLKLAAEIPHKTADGGSDGSIALPSQQFAAVWSKSLENFVQADIDYRDIKLVSTSEPKMTMGLGEIAVKLDGTDKGQGHWDEVETFKLANLTVDDPDGNFVIGAIDGKTTIANYNAKAMADFRNQAEAAAAKAEAAAAGTTNTGTGDAGTAPPAPDPQFVESLRGLGSLFANLSTNVQFSGISYKDPAGKDMFALPEGTLSFGADGFDQPIGKLALSITHKGLVVGDVDPALKDMVPQELAMNASLENLPVQELWKGVVDTYLSSGMTTDQGASMAFAMFPALLQQSLTTGKAKLNLTDWRIVMALAQAQLAGTIEGSPDAMMGAIGKLKLDITGLDKLIDGIKAQAGQDAPELASLDVLRGFSNRATASDGSVVDHYDIDLTPQGQVMVNGKEFPLFGGAPGEPPPQDGTTPPAGEVSPEDGTSGGTSSGSN